MARRALATFLLLVLVGGTWALAVPLFAGPDEPSHLRRSAALVRGQVADEPHVRPGYATVEVPAVFEGSGDCYMFQPEVDARCLEVPESTGTIDIGHTALDYPPLYHAVVGAPSLVTDGVAGIYLMRLAAVVVAAALVAGTVATIAAAPSPGPALLGLGAALTPMALFSMSVVNPSGVAIASGIAAWCWGYHLVRRAPLGRLRPAATGTGVALCTLLLQRRDSLLWAGLVIVALAALTPSARWRGLLRSRAVHVSGVAVAAAGAVQLAFSGSAASGFAGQAGTDDVEVDPGWAWDELGERYRQMVGVLGWLDTEIPVLAQVAVSVVLFGLVAWAVARAPRRTALVLVGVVALTVAAVLGFAIARPGYVQGRYLLPFAVGVPLLAGQGLAEARRRLPPAALAAGLALLVVAEVLAFVACLRRFSVGADGPWWFPPEPGWDPPMAPGAVFVVLNLAAMVALAVHWYRLAGVGPIRRR